VRTLWTDVLNQCMWRVSSWLVCGGEICSLVTRLRVGWWDIEVAYQRGLVGACAKDGGHSGRLSCCAWATVRRYHGIDMSLPVSGGVDSWGGGLADAVRLRFGR